MVGGMHEHHELNLPPDCYFSRDGCCRFLQIVLDCARTHTIRFNHAHAKCRQVTVRKHISNQFLPTRACVTLVYFTLG